MVDWALYGWTCYTHRAAVIQALTAPLQPAAIRRRIIQENPHMKISANNVTDILRLFLRKRIIRPIQLRRKVHLRYELTELGNKLQKLLSQIDEPSIGMRHINHFILDNEVSQAL